MKTRISILLAFLCVWTVSMAGSALAATRYYSRDGSGTKDGLSYANRGAYASVTTLRASPGDTIYFCGDFVPRTSSIPPVTIASSGTAAAPITIRMDYPGDPGKFYNSSVASWYALPALAWTGPDAKGYYRYAHRFTNMLAANLGTSREEILPLVTTASASDPNGYWTDSSGTYVKLSGGGNPSGRVYQVAAGYRFTITGRSYLTFKNCTSVGTLVATTTNAHHITFDACVVRFCQLNAFTLRAGNDNWTFLNCTIDHVGNGIYAVITGAAPPAVDISAQNCTILGGRISYCGYLAGRAYINGDSHGVGTQNVSGWVIDGLEVDHTCSAIEMFRSYNNPNTNNTIRNCAIHDTDPDFAVTNAGGITMYLTTDSYPSTDNFADIHNNVFWNIAGTAISCNSLSPATRVENNSVFNCGARMGPRITRNGATERAWWAGAGITFRNGTCRNNIVQGCRYFIKLSPNDPSLTKIDYNLFNGRGSAADFHCLGNESLAQWQARGYDTHSRTGSPGWVRSAPTTRADFQLLTSSQAINSGASVSYTDPDGKAIGKTMGTYAAPQTPPRIGFVVTPKSAVTPGAPSSGSVVGPKPAPAAVPSGSGSAAQPAPSPTPAPSSAGFAVTPQLPPKERATK